MLHTFSGTFIQLRAGDTGGPGDHGLLTFLRSKKKKGKQRKARKTFKAEPTKRLSLSSKCYCFRHSRASRIQKFFLSINHSGRQFFSVFYGPSTLKSISPTLQLNICEWLLMKLEIFKDRLTQFIIPALGKTSIQQEIFGEKMFCGKCSCRVIRTTDENSWKAS